MGSEPNTVNILVVDDKAENLLAFDAILQDLRAEHHSRELGQGRASAAASSRLRRDSARHQHAGHGRVRDGDAHSPARQISAGSHHLPDRLGGRGARGEATLCGAVDYILTPVTPEVLKTKVGVLVDLYARTAEVKRQAEALRLQTEQLHKLTSASMRINSALSLGTMLSAITESAREVLGAHQAITTTTWDSLWRARAPRCRSRNATPPSPPLDRTARAMLSICDSARRTQSFG